MQTIPVKLTKQVADGLTDMYHYISFTVSAPQ